MGFARWPDAAKRTVFRLDKVEAQRPRAPAKEWQFERPWEYLADTTGTYAGKALDMAASLYEEWNAGERTEPLPPSNTPSRPGSALRFKKIWTALAKPQRSGHSATMSGEPAIARQTPLKI